MGRGVPLPLPLMPAVVVPAALPRCLEMLRARAAQAGGTNGEGPTVSHGGKRRRDKWHCREETRVREHLVSLLDVQCKSPCILIVAAAAAAPPVVLSWGARERSSATEEQPMRPCRPPRTSVFPAC